MRKFNKKEQLNVKTLTYFQVGATYLEPTETGLKKSIMDATAMVRQFLSDFKIHNFKLQKQGEKHKVMCPASIIDRGNLIETKASLYRPLTKSGDPRIWIYGLGKFISPNEILAVLVLSGQLFVFNLSRVNLEEIMSQESGPLYELILQISQKQSRVASELLRKLRKISRMGLIKSEVRGDTSVGRTLETHLGIRMNSNQIPDYKGIELKSFRSKKVANRKTLFAQVPDWSISKFKSSEDILRNFGYKRNGAIRLNCTVSALGRNSQGLMLCLEELNDFLHENSSNRSIGDFVTWRLEKLKSRLSEKHKETFWIKAKSKKVRGIEYFEYVSVEHTRRPILSQFVTLIEQGNITVDHLIKKVGKTGVSERGPLFKLSSDAIGLLFPSSIKHKLS